MHLTGFLNLRKEIVCKEEVLGQTLKAVINDVEVEISFPRLSGRSFNKRKKYVGLSNPLLAPVRAENWKQGGKALVWGYPISYPEKNATVCRVVVFAEVPGSDEQTDESSVIGSIQKEEIAYLSDALYEDMCRWEAAFADYCALVSRQACHRKKHFMNNVCRFSLYTNEYIPNTHSSSVYADILKNREALSLSQVKEACKFASSGRELKLEYQMLLSSYVAVQKGQNRRAALEAASAAELVIDKRLRQYCASKEIEEDILLTKYNSLGEKTALLKRVDPGFIVPDVTENLVQVKRRLMENETEIPSDAETDLLIMTVERCVALYHESYY